MGILRKKLCMLLYRLQLLKTFSLSDCMSLFASMSRSMKHYCQNWFLVTNVHSHLSGKVNCHNIHICVHWHWKSALCTGTLTWFPKSERVLHYLFLTCLHAIFFTDFHYYCSVLEYNKIVVNAVIREKWEWQLCISTWWCSFSFSVWCAWVPKCTLTSSFDWASFWRWCKSFADIPCLPDITSSDLLGVSERLHFRISSDVAYVL